MITGGKKWNYFPVKSLSRLLREITLNYDGDDYCMNYHYSFATEGKLKSHEKVCKNYDSCHTVIPEEGKNILKEYPFIIYIKTELLLKKIHACDSNPEESPETKIRKHKGCGYSLFTHRVFNSSKRKQGFYRGADCMTAWKNFVQI